MANKRYEVYRELPNGKLELTTSKDNREDVTRVVAQLTTLGFPVKVVDTKTEVHPDVEKVVNQILN